MKKESTKGENELTVTTKCGLSDRATRGPTSTFATKSRVAKVDLVLIYL